MIESKKYNFMNIIIQVFVVDLFNVNIYFSYVDICKREHTAGPMIDR